MDLVEEVRLPNQSEEGMEDHFHHCLVVAKVVCSEETR
jgi:hypothetical protein